ncbi:MAG: hypothetical protein KF914_01810 [Rhizobiaceae bacterium]|nr:hypothetical protein [Rhizobiaceae bacterium]
MKRILPALHEGHAPVDLHNAFADALDAFDDWGLGAPEPAVEFGGDQVAISAVFGRMRTCDDILPERLRLAVDDIVGPGALDTGASAPVRLADAALRLRALCVERLTKGGG